MKSFWAQQPMTNQVYSQCLDKEQDLRLYKLFSISSIILKDYMEKSGFKRFEKISLKEKLNQFLAMNPIQCSSPPTALNTVLQSKRVIIVHPNGKPNSSNCYILRNWGCLLQTSRSFERHLLQIKNK